MVIRVLRGTSSRWRPDWTDVTRSNGRGRWPPPRVRWMGDERSDGSGRAWRRRPGYLDTATYGLPPTATVELGHRVLEDWAEGSVDWRGWHDAADRARHSFAALVGVDADTVATGSAASAFVGLLAANLPDDAEVVAPDQDFTSLLYPFLVQEARGVRVRTVPLEALADAIEPST